MDTIVLSDLFGARASDQGRSAIRSSANSKPADSTFPPSYNFAAGLHPPKLSYEKAKFQNWNPNPLLEAASQSQISLKANAKMREFKERLKLSKSLAAGPELVQSTGLFSFDNLEEKLDDNSSAGAGTKKKTIRLNQPFPPPPAKDGDFKLKSILRNKNRTEAVDAEIHHRIDKAYKSIEALGRGFSGFDRTLKDATERAVADGKASRKMMAETTLPSLQSQASKERMHPKEILDVKRPPKKVFGLDTSNLLHAGTSGDDSDEDVDLGATYSRLSQAARNMERKSATPAVDIQNYKQGSISRKEMFNAKTHKDVMEKQSEREIRHANVERKKASMFHSRNNLSKLMGFNPNQGPGRDLTDFLQSSGGIHGGWDPEDHNLFLTHYNRWKNRPPRLINLVQKDVPDKRVEEIAEHVTWFEKYEALNKANKTFIRQWQISRRREKEALHRKAKQEQLAKLEENKRKHDTIKLQREEEREKSRLKLDEWKSSIAFEKKMMRINADLIREPKNQNRVEKLQEAMADLKQGFFKMEPRNPIVRKYLAKHRSATLQTTSKLLSSAKYKESDGTESSGVFSDGEQDFDDARSGVTEESLGLGGSTNWQRDYMIQDPEPQKPKGKMIMEIFQSRDAQMVGNRRLAIQAKVEEKRNKTHLTSAEVKERIKSNDAPSKLMKPTKVWTNRQEAKDVEKQRTAVLQGKQNEKLNQHNAVRMDMFQPGNSIRLVPKLATPGWRKY